MGAVLGIADFNPIFFSSPVSGKRGDDPELRAHGTLFLQRRTGTFQAHTTYSWHGLYKVGIAVGPRVKHLFCSWATWPGRETKSGFS